MSVLIMDNENIKIDRNSDNAEVVRLHCSFCGQGISGKFDFVETRRGDRFYICEKCRREKWENMY